MIHKIIKFFSRLLAGIFSKEKLINFLKEKLVKTILKKLLFTGGIKVWVVTYIIENLFDEIAAPIIKGGARKVGWYFDVQEGKHDFKKIEEADNIDDWRDAIRNS